MTIKIRIKNFQSLEDTGLDVDGFTVVTGQNNSGKTALMRAVKGLFENTGGDSFVRHGSNGLNVNITFQDAQVTWSKGPKQKPAYLIGGKHIHPGRSVPDEVRQLGVVPIKAGNTEVWPQIASQFDGQLFLLNQPGSAIAEAVADVARVSQLTAALAFAESDKRAASSTLSIRRQDEVLALASVHAFDGLDVASEVHQTAQEALQQAVALGVTVGKAHGVQAALVAAQTRVAALAGAAAVRVPDASSVLDTATLVGPVQQLASRIRGARQVVDKAPQDVMVPSITGLTEMSQDLDFARQMQGRLKSSQTIIKTMPSKVFIGSAEVAIQLSRAESEARPLQQRLSRIRAVLQQAPPKVVVPAPDNAEGVAAVVLSAQQMAARLQSARRTMQRLQVPGSVSVPEFDPTKLEKWQSGTVMLQGFKQRITSARAMVYSLEGELRGLTSELAQSQASLDGMWVGDCPTCGATLDPQSAHLHKDGV